MLRETVLLGRRGLSGEDPQESPQISQGHREVRGQGRPVFRTIAWITRDTSMFLESQMVLEEQEGFGNSEKSASQ